MSEPKNIEPKDIKEKNYAFIDSQNLNLSIQNQGWKLDFKKFRIYLSDKYKVQKAFLFIGYVQTMQSLYTSLQQYGYILIFKPTLDLGHGKIKGNVDAELVLHSMIEYPNYDKALIVSGDGDFFCLVEYLVKKVKLEKLIIPDRHKYSSLLREFKPYMAFMTDLESKLKLE
jgi:uncharacterized LabA/DUF88 family protein